MTYVYIAEFVLQREGRMPLGAATTVRGAKELCQEEYDQDRGREDLEAQPLTWKPIGESYHSAHADNPLDGYAVTRLRLREGKLS